MTTDRDDIASLLERVTDLTRPIIGIENRTAREVFDIMCGRIQSSLPEPSENSAKALEWEYYVTGEGIATWSAKSPFGGTYRITENEGGWHCRSVGTFGTVGEAKAACLERLAFAALPAWARDELTRLRAALDSPPDHGGGEGELLAAMSQHLGWELDWGSRDPNDEEGEYGWRVHDMRGNRSDLEWTLIGFGASPADALRASLPTQESEDGR